MDGVKLSDISFVMIKKDPMKELSSDFYRVKETYNEGFNDAIDLRDYFAIHAPSHEIDGMMKDDKIWCANLIGIEEQHYAGSIHYKMVVSKLRYQYADAMLLEREKSK